MGFENKGMAIVCDHCGRIVPEGESVVIWGISSVDCLLTELEININQEIGGSMYVSADEIDGIICKNCKPKCTVFVSDTDFTNFAASIADALEVLETRSGKKANAVAKMLKAQWRTYTGI